MVFQHVVTLHEITVEGMQSAVTVEGVHSGWELQHGQLKHSLL
jgi:hypothetical protein